MNEVQFEVCPETGIGCLMIQNDGDSVKVDLMPDEAADLQSRVKAGDLAGARTLLASIDSSAGAALDGDSLQALAREVG